MKKLNMSIRLLGLTALVLCPMVRADQEFDPEGRGNIVQKLGLSPDQKHQFQELRKKRHQELASLREKAQDSRRALRSAMDSEATDEALRSAYTTMQSANAQVAAARFESMLELRKILTPEQRKKFRELRSEHKKHGKGE